MIVLLSKDLFFVPVVQSAAKRFHQQLLVISHVEDSKLEALEPSEVVAVLVDLSAISAEMLGEAAEHLSSMLPGVILAAFGSHVHTGRLESASACGFNPVLTRGQLNNRLPQIMQEWVESRS